MNKRLVFLAAIILLVCTLYNFFELHRFLTLDYLQQSKGSFIERYHNNSFYFTITFFLIYVLVTALSIPAATILTLLAGLVFGPINGVIIVSFASSLGATVAMLIARYILREHFSQKFSKQLATINKGIKIDGNTYLFALRLTPLFPFFMVNIIFGLTQFKAKNFFIISQIGMLPATIIYVYAGYQLSIITDIRDILSIEMIITLSLIGFFPLIAKKMLSYLRKRQSNE